MTTTLFMFSDAASDPRLKPRLGVYRSSGGATPVYGQVPSREFTRGA